MWNSFIGWSGNAYGNNLSKNFSKRNRSDMRW